MASRQGLIDRLRLEMADFEFAFYFTLLGDGTRTRVELPHEHIRSALVYVDSVLQTAVTDYLLDTVHGIIVFTVAPPAGKTVVVDGFYNELFTDEQFGSWVDTAFSLHAVDRNPALTFGTLPAPEDYLVVMLAKVEALWVMATSAAYDIDIRTIEGVSIPRSQRFAQLMALVNGVKAQYAEWAQNLNVGPGRIQNIRLRRVSRITNRYVPIYLQREVDDMLPPQRVFPSIDSNGADVPSSSVPVYDIEVARGQSYTEELTFRDEAGVVIDLTGYTFRACIYRSQHETGEVDTFAVLETDLVNGVIALTLTKAQTAEFEQRSSLVYQLLWTPPAGEEEAVLHGDVLVEFLMPVDAVVVDG